MNYSLLAIVTTTRIMDPNRNSSLPPPRPDQTFVTVSAIEGGSITLPDRCFVTPSSRDERRTVPSLAFLIEHPRADLFGHNGLGDKPFRFMFDLGLRSELRRYIPAQQAHLVHREPYLLGPGVVGNLKKRSLTPADINAVVLSHVHYDHHGDPEDFDQSTFIVGPGSLEILQNGLPGTTATHQCFDPNLLPKNRTVELPPVSSNGTRTKMPNGTSVEWLWDSIGPFPAALDLFGDSSVYVVDSPGHLPGHIILLCQTSPGKWLLLGGDACHDIRLLTREREIGTWMNEHGETICIHLDRKGAEESIRRIQELMASTVQSKQEVEVVLAHDSVWYERNQHRMFPTTL